MAQNAKLDLLIGKKVTIGLTGRLETELYGEILGHDERGSLLSVVDRGREFIYYVPLSSTVYIEHKIKDDKEE